MRDFLLFIATMVISVIVAVYAHAHGRYEFFIVFLLCTIVIRMIYMQVTLDEIKNGGK